MKSTDINSAPSGDGDDSAVSGLVVAVAAAMKDNRKEIAHEMITRITSELAEVSTDPRIVSLLTSAAEGSVAANVKALEESLKVERPIASTAALEYARVLAQRGLPIAVLERGYLLDHNIFLRWCVERLGILGADPTEVTQATLVIMSRVSARTDNVHQQMLDTYEAEREAWLRHRSTARSARISDLLDGQPIEITAAEQALGYRLGQHHLGLIAWTDSSSGIGDDLAQLERAVLTVARKLECYERPLFEPRDERTAWAWLPLGDHKYPDISSFGPTIQSMKPLVTVAVGAPQEGAAGFARTHRQAAKATVVARTSPIPGPRVVPFEEVGAVALMCADLEAAGEWVHHVLRRLAANDSTAEMYRQTLRTFFSTGGSYTATAVALTLHRNSVIYRVRKIEKLLGRPVRKSQLELEMALALCHWLGSAVLDSSTSATK